MRESVKKIVLSVACMIFAIPFLQPKTLLAQSLLQSWSTQPQLSFEFYHPDFSHLNYKGLTSISFLSLRYPVGENLLLDADLPFLYFKNPGYYIYTSPGTGHFSPGNPYIGVTVYNPTSPVTVNVGLRIPLISRDNFNYPIIANSTTFYRYHSASQHVLTLTLRGHYFGKINPAINYQLYLGGLAVLNTEGSSGQLLVPYGISLRYQKERAILGGGVSGILSVTEQHANLGQRSMNHLYVEGGLNLTSWSPDVYLAFPLDKDSSNLINLIIGLRITMKLNQIGK